LGRALAPLLLDRLAPDGPVDPVGDAAVNGHPGPKGYGKGGHRDAVRSSRAYAAWRYGHDWVVPAVPVEAPSAARRRALPVLVDPYRTPAQSMCRLLRPVPIRFPGRAFVSAGDSGFGTHGVARFCRRHRARPTPASECHPDTNPSESPPPYRGRGRPRVKGMRVPKPRRAAATARPTRPAVTWYGGGERRVAAATGAGHWYKGGEGPVPVRWVYVEDTTGTPRDESPVHRRPGRDRRRRGRQRLRPPGERGDVSGLPVLWGLETTRGRSRATVGRAARCPFGSYPVAAAPYHAPPKPSGRGRCRGPGRRRRRSRTPSPPPVDGSGPRTFPHRPGSMGPSQNAPRVCGTYCCPVWPRPHELHKSS